MGHGLHFGFQQRIAAREEGGQPAGRQRRAAHRGNRIQLFADGLAEEAPGGVLQADVDAELIEHLPDQPVDEGFAVDQHAVAIEQDGVEAAAGGGEVGDFSHAFLVGFS